MKKNVKLAPYTTFHVGGTARYLSIVKTTDDVKESLAFALENQITHIILGKGSNSLLKDQEFPGIVIVNKIDFLNIEAEMIHVGSGFFFPLLASKAASLELTGLEFASGIPGSVGGAIYMNAGAIGQETFDTLEEVEFIDINGEEYRFSKSDISYGYRTSAFQKMQGMITGATLRLKKGSDVREKLRKMLEARFATQPYKARTAGCFFRNPKEGSAGALIDSLGLKGLSIGGARISSVHANFIENFDKATAEDVLELVEVIQRIVYEKKGIHLEIEVKILGA